MFDLTISAPMENERTMMTMANFYQVFKNELICKYAKPYCEYDGDERTGCGKGALMIC